jgi:CpcD/allophycocyanin linker domain
MYGQSTSDEAVTASGNRVFHVKVSEVGGYAKNKHLSGYKAPIRQANYTLTIPYDRLSMEMQRIVKSGAKVVSVTPVVS